MSNLIIENSDTLELSEKIAMMIDLAISDKLTYLVLSGKRDSIELSDNEKVEYRNDASFIADVSARLDLNFDINVAADNHAHEVFCDELDKYFGLTYEK